MKRWGRWTYDPITHDLTHDNGCRRIDLWSCVDALEIADIVFHIADKPEDEQSAEDVGDLVRALMHLFPVRDWLGGALEKSRVPMISDEVRSRLH